MLGKIGCTASKWWRETNGVCGCADRIPDISPCRSNCMERGLNVNIENLFRYQIHKKFTIFDQKYANNKNDLKYF